MSKKPNLLLPVTIVLAAILLIAGCKRSGKIPVDEKRASQNIIPIEQGKKYSEAFIFTRDNELPKFMTDSNFLKNRFNLPNYETFNRDAIAALLNAEGADGVRIYMGKDSLGMVNMVLVPVDKEGRNIITHLIGSDVLRSARTFGGGGSGGDAVENGQRCPPPDGSCIPL